MGIHVGKPVRGRWPIIRSSGRGMEVLAWCYASLEAQRVAWNMRRSDEFNGKPRHGERDGR